MTNKIYPAIQDIKTKIRNSGGILFVGEYPDDLSVIGQRFPACIIQDGNETYDLHSGNQYVLTIEIRVILLTEIITGKTKMENLLDLQAEINNAILADLTLSGTAVNIMLTEVDKDLITNEAGQQISQRVLKYTCEIHDTRI